MSAVPGRRLGVVLPLTVAGALVFSVLPSGPARAEDPAAPPVPASPGEGLPDTPPAPAAQAEDPGTVSAVVVTDEGAEVVTVAAEPHEVDEVAAQLQALPGDVTVAVDAPVSVLEESTTVAPAAGATRSTGYL